MKVLHFLKEHSAEILSLFATIAYGTYAYLGHVHDFEGFAKLLGIGLSAVLAIQLTLSFEIPRRFSESKDSLKKTITETLDNLDKYGTHLIPFDDENAYQELFAGLSGKVRSYNPHPFSEKSGAIFEINGVNTMRERLADQNFALAEYIVCTGDEYGKEQFARLLRRLFHVYKDDKDHKKLLEAIINKVRIHIVTDAGFLSEPTYHLQHKGDSDRGVIELKLMSEDRRPRFFLVSNLVSFRESLGTSFDSKRLVAGDPIDLTKIFTAIEDRNSRNESELDVVKRLLDDGKVS